MRALLPLLLVLLPAAVPPSHVRAVLVDDELERFSGTVELLQQGKVLRRVQAGTDGVFELDLAPGPYQLRFSGSSLCVSVTQELTVKQGEDLETAYQVSRCKRLEGRALAVDASPLREATVTLRYGGSGEDVSSARTDEAGRFVFERSVKRPFKVSLADPAGEPIEVDVHRGPDGALELRAIRTARFQVRGSDGAPLRDAFVSLVAEPLETENRQGKTGPRGRLSLPVAVGMRYRALVYWEQEDAFRRYAWKDFETVKGTRDPQVEVRFQPLPATPLRGRIVDGAGKPLAGAKVTATQLFTSLPLDDALLRNTAYPRTSVTVRADAEGRYVLRGLQPGEAWVDVEHPLGSRETVVRLAPSTGDLVVPTECADRVTLRVLDEGGQAISALEVPPARAAGAPGRFELTQRCGYVYLRASGFLGRVITLPTPVAEHVNLGDVVLARGRRIQGRVLRGDGAPVRGEGVSASWSHPREAREVSQTDSAGHFDLGPVSALEDIEVEARVDDVVLRRRIGVAETGEVLLQHPATSRTLEVRVRDARGTALPQVRVFAEGTSHTVGVRTDESGVARFTLSPGPYQLWVEQELSWATGRDIVPPRFPPTSAQVPARGSASIELRAMRGSGKLRVLLPRWTHYDDVQLVPGAHPWPRHGHALFGSWERTLPADREADVSAQPAVSSIGYSILTDFSDLPQGTYTVIAKRSYGDDAGERYFRKVVEVAGTRRQVVQVRFDGADARNLPW